MNMISSKTRCFRCHICEQVFSRYDDMQAHFKTIHIHHLTCPYCDKIFSNMKELIIHKHFHIKFANENARNQNKLDNQNSNWDGKEEVDGGQISPSHTENSEADAADVHWNVQCRLSKAMKTPNVSSNCISQSVGGKNNECIVKNDNKKSEETSLSSSKEICDVSSEVPREVAFNNVQFKVVGEVETKFALEQEASGCQWSDLSVSIPAEGDQHIKIPEGLKTCTDVINSTMKKQWTQCRYCTPKQAEHAYNACKKKYHSMKELKSQIKGAQVRRITCLFCNEGFLTRSQYMHHSVSHLNTYFTPSSGEEFQNGNIEQNPSGGIKKDSLSKEKMGIILSEMVKDNSLKVLKPKEFKCRLCPGVFYSLEAVHHHIKEVHINRLLCLLCNLKFIDKNSLCGHAQKYHGVVLKSGAIWPDKPSCSRPISPSACNVNEGKISATVECKLYSDPLIPTEESSCSFPTSTSVNVENNSSLDVLRSCMSIDHSEGNVGAAIGCELHNGDRIPTDEGKCGSPVSPSLCEEKDASLPSMKPAYNYQEITALLGWEPYSSVHVSRVEGKCDQCGLCFNSGSSLLFHRRTHEKAYYKCGVCNFSSPSKECVMTHLNKEGHSFQFFFFN